MTAALRKGWCPTALRPMQTGDGWLVRLRPPCGVLSLDQAAGVAACAAAFGNGHLDLTSRANLQIRGVREAGLVALVEHLRALGLVEPQGEPEAARNILTSPLAGIDPGELIDVRPVAAALAARLAADPALRRLPAKFGFVLDGGGWLGLGNVPADVRFVAAGQGRFEVRLAGGDAPLGVCEVGRVADVAATVAGRFLRVCGDVRRMRPLIERSGTAVFTRDLGRGPLLPLRGKRWPDEVGSDEGASAASIPLGAEQGGCKLNRPHPTLAHARAAVSRVAGDGVRAELLGVHPTHLGLAAPFGRLEAADLALLADLARRHAAADLRLTPWRALLVTGVTPTAGASLAGALDPARFILDPVDPRLAVAACPGAPACPNATTRTRDDADTLAPLMLPASTMTLHVSGCAKGCAHGAAAPVTLVAEAGRYALVRDGTAQCAPIATGLTLAAAAAMLADITAEGGAAA